MAPNEEDPEIEAVRNAQPGGERGEIEAEAGSADDERVETPFDHPLFLPVVLFGLSLWFLWDGFIVPMEEHLLFNRGGFAVFSLATLWFGYKGIQEMRAGREESSSPDERDA